MACCPLDRLPVDILLPSVRVRKPVPVAAVSVSVSKARRYRPMKAVHLFSSSSTVLFPKVKRHSECPCRIPADFDEAVSDLLLWEPAQRSIGSVYYILFTSCCYALYTIFSKHLLNAFPFPWLVSASYAATGAVFMLWSIRLRGYTPPETDLNFWKSLFPVAVAHSVGLVASTICLSKLSASLTHVLSCRVSFFMAFLTGKSYPRSILQYLLSIVGGCALAVATEININTTGLNAALVANFAFSCRNLLSKRGIEMEGKKATQVNYYGCLSIMSLLILAPFALAIEGPKLWAAGWKTATSEIGTLHMLGILTGHSLLYQLYNEDAFRFFPNIEPYQFVTVNTMKKAIGFICSRIIFDTPALSGSILYSAIAITGIFFYSRDICVISSDKYCSKYSDRGLRRLSSWFL